MENLLKVEVCFSPALYTYFENPEAVTIVVDILRASSAICTAFMNGVEKIIPVATLEEAEGMKEQGYMVAAERDGIVQGFCRFRKFSLQFHSRKSSRATHRLQHHQRHAGHSAGILQRGGDRGLLSEPLGRRRSCDPQPAGCPHPLCRLEK